MRSALKSFLLLPALLAGLVVCGCGGSDRTLSVEEALHRSGEATVEGFLVAPEGSQTRLCSALLESYPPQCGRPSLVIRGLDPNTVSGLTRTGDPSLAQVTWSEAPVTLRGTLSGGILTVSGA